MRRKNESEKKNSTQKEKYKNKNIKKAEYR